jgi:ABC-type oligopeptide transport system substrate-binding subunit
MRKRILALIAVLALAAACTGGGGEGPTPTASPTFEPWHGGTVRLALVGVDPWRLDPQREVDDRTAELFRCCLLRTLFSYNGLPVSEGGAAARPDLASGQPEVSADGLTWMIRIKAGVHYAPPLEDVEITSQDFVRALLRMADPAVTRGSYNLAFEYSVIGGFDAYRSGDADTISGLETPDAHTLVVRLTEPAGDLPDKLALAATAPIPPNPNLPDAASALRRATTVTTGGSWWPPART